MLRVGFSVAFAAEHDLIIQISCACRQQKSEFDVIFGFFFMGLL